MRTLPGPAAMPVERHAAVHATFRFYEELNDFLAPDRRRREFSAPCARTATTKQMIEALGVPHTEVELILVNGESVGFDRLLADGDRVAVYPTFEAFDVTPLLRLREHPLRVSRFVADAHLGGLAHLLRMMGFDTLYDNAVADDAIERLAASEHRIVLTRDRELLKRSGVTHGMYVRALRSTTQLREVFERLDLARSARPFTRCLHCNHLLVPIDKARALPVLPQGVAAKFERFSSCEGCARVLGRQPLAPHARPDRRRAGRGRPCQRATVMNAAGSPPSAGNTERAELIRITGRVQGVGFRADAQRLALQYGLRGWVANVGRGVVIHACGQAERLDAFVRAMGEDIGPPARIDNLQREPAELLPRGAAFVIAPTDTPLSAPTARPKR